MQRLLALLITLSALFAPYLQAETSSSALEINAVKIHVDKNDRIFVSYQKQCGAQFAGFILRSSAEKELFVAALTHRPNGRCMDLSPLEELLVPHLRASSFAGVTSLNPSTEPQFLKLSPIQNFNQVRDDEEFRLEAAYTSQCGTLLGLNLYPTANGFEISTLEGRSGKFDGCNRSTKLARYAHLDFSGAPLRAHTQFQDSEFQSPRYTLRRAQTRILEDGAARKLFFFRRCSEAPVGLIRQPTEKGLTISVLLAHYPDMKCPEGAAERIWTPWPEPIYDEAAIAFPGTRAAEQLVIKRPVSYNFTQDTLTVASHGSCQKDVGIVSRSHAKGYAVGILQIQTSAPCNSSMKEVNFTLEWNFAHGVKRDIKPLQLVGS